jgi:hypothetical protein
MSSISFDVRPDGSFGREYESEEAPYRLSQWVLPAGYQGKLSLEKIRVKHVVEKRWTLDFDTTAIIRDADLVANAPRRIRGSNVD